MKCKGGTLEVFAHAGGGRSLPASSGRVFEPTDIEVGPDGALYVLSWGHGYGGTIKDGKQIDAGRVYRIRHKDNPLTNWSKEHRTKPHSEWTRDELFDDLGSSIPAWRVNAQEELLRRDTGFGILHSVVNTALTESHATRKLTWALWTMGRDSINSRKGDQPFVRGMRGKFENVRLQSARILAFRHRERRRAGPPSVPTDPQRRCHSHCPLRSPASATPGPRTRRGRATGPQPDLSRR